MSEHKLVRAKSASMELVSLTFDDDVMGSLKWGEVLRGTGRIPSRVRLDKVAPSEDGRNLLVQLSVLEFIEVGGRTIDRLGDDEVIAIEINRLYALIAEAQRFTKSFVVDGLKGPMTLEFVYLGLASDSHESTLHGENLVDLSQEEVQWWYKIRGWPRGGILKTTTRRGYPKSLWQLL